MREMSYIPDELKKAVELAWQKGESEIFELLRIACKNCFIDTYRFPDEKPIKDSIQRRIKYIYQHIDECKENEVCRIEKSKLKKMDYLLELEDSQIEQIHSVVFTRK